MTRQRTLYIVRGLPGSGKTTLARQLTEHVFSADDYFYDLGNGQYKFDPEHLPDAHKTCQWKVEAAMIAGYRILAVANTFSMAWEAEIYFELAKKHEYIPCIIECQSQFGNVHAVPQTSISNMKERWEPLCADKKENYENC